MQDLSGRQYGAWTVLERIIGTRKWLCRCSCGVERGVFGPNLKNGLSKSCGHTIGISAKSRFTKHGLASSKPHMIWVSMRKRCNNPSDKAYKWYGAKGVKVHPAWESFENFWADMGPSYKEGLSIERVDVTGGYEPGNCTWITRSEQTRNKRVSLWVETPAGSMLACDAARLYGLTHATIHGRWTSGKRGAALVAPVQRAKRITDADLDGIDLSRLMAAIQRRESSCLESHSPLEITQPNQ